MLSNKARKVAKFFYNIMFLMAVAVALFSPGNTVVAVYALAAAIYFRLDYLEQVWEADIALLLMALASEDVRTQIKAQADKLAASANNS